MADRMPHQFWNGNILHAARFSMVAGSFPPHTFLTYLVVYLKSRIVLFIVPPNWLLASSGCTMEPMMPIGSKAHAA
jgi:hypothetical protein